MSKEEGGKYLACFTATISTLSRGKITPAGATSALSAVSHRMEWFNMSATPKLQHLAQSAGCLQIGRCEITKSIATSGRPGGLLVSRSSRSRLWQARLTDHTIRTTHNQRGNTLQRCWGRWIPQAVTCWPARCSIICLDSRSPRSSANSPREVDPSPRGAPIRIQLD